MDLHERVREMEEELERLRFDHGFLVAVMQELAAKLARTGKLLATDRRVFQEDAEGNCQYFEPGMPTLLELLQGYVAERANGKVPA